MSVKHSRLLIDEQPLQVIPTLAVELGLNRAMFIQQLHYWLNKPTAHVRDDRRWIYNTFQEWHEQFPFWSPEAIRKIASQLQKAGLIDTTARHNKRKGDRTLWYTINYDALNALFDTDDEAPDESTEPHDQPEKSTEPPEKSTERYQRVPESPSFTIVQEGSDDPPEEKSKSGEDQPGGNHPAPDIERNPLGYYCQALVMHEQPALSPADRKTMGKNFQDLNRLEKPDRTELHKVIGKMIDAKFREWDISPQKALADVRNRATGNVHYLGAAEQPSVPGGGLRELQ